MNMKKNDMKFSDSIMAKYFVLAAIGVMAILLVVIIIMLGLQVDNDRPENPNQISSAESNFGTVGEFDLPELKIESIEEEGDQMVVSTSYCTFKYPMAYSDLISVEAYQGDGMSGIRFTAKIGGEQIPIYSLLFNSQEGGEFGTLDIEGVAESVRVSVVFAELPADIKDDDKATFFATQETVNDVERSLSEFDGYTSSN
ncbi:MAG: hypothetical protein IJD70_03330 [Clostridia bacterium]|nr:hypothetical protein [Clostridia bacterium]